MARLVRPSTPAGFDASRAAQRAADPYGWRYGDEARAAVHRVIAERRDIRRFRPERVPADVLRRVLEAAHRAPSVGLMQPWRLIVVSELSTRIEVRRLAQRERLRQADRFDERARQFLDQKIEGVVEAPLGICVCCDHGDPAVEVLGRGTIPETDVYSTACAIENLWLAARAEGLGVGWVSYYRPDDLRALLAIPARVEPIAYLCLGWPDERPQRPGLEAAGWTSRVALDEVVMSERWRDGGDGAAASASVSDRDPASASPTGLGHVPAAASDADRTRAPAVEAIPDRAAATAVRDRLDALVKPAGSLGALEALIERWAAITGAPPPRAIRAGVLVCAADHGHVVHGTSLFHGGVSAQVTAAAARGESAVGVLARRGGHELLVADVGLAGPTPDGVRDAKVARGSADMLAGAALTPAELDAALAAGAALCAELAQRGIDCLVLGEIGIGNTATTAALTCALTGAAPERTVGRGAGLDTAGVERKRAVVSAAIARHRAARAAIAACDRPPDDDRPADGERPPACDRPADGERPVACDRPADGAPADGDRPGAAAREALLTVGGLELAALAGAIVEAVARRLPVILDGYAVGAAALAAVGLLPAAGEILIAAHRSSEPGHALVLAELGLEPLLDLRLRLGEASGGLLALPLIEAAGALHREMATFAEAGIERG